MKIVSIYSWLQSVGYRLGQVREQLGFVAPLSKDEYKEVAGLLPTTGALSLFRTMSPADQQHSLRVCRRLKTRGCKDDDMLAAALLHDVGKAEGRVPFWTRPAIVLGKKLAPQLLKRLVIYPIEKDRSQPVQLVGAGEERSGEGTLASSLLGEQEGTKGGPRAPSTAPPHSRPYGFDYGDGGKHRRSIVPNWRLALSYAWYHADIGAELALKAGLSERAVLYIRTHHRSDGPAAELHEVDEVS